MSHPLDKIAPPPEMTAEELRGWHLAMSAARDATITLNQQPLYEGQVVIRIHAISQEQAERILSEVLRFSQWRQQVKDVIVKDRMRLAEERREPLS